MKRTYWKAERINGSEYEWTAKEKITCEVTGEMDTGAKVWTDIKTGEQYFCFRLMGKYYFYKG